MGGSSKKQTVGYKYYLGMHMILTHGPADYLTRITVDNKIATQGFYTGEISANINRPGLFGGKKREGGVQGTVDIEMGELTQTPNDYLQARLGSNIPAYRGVVGVVLRRVYLGVNPYLKRWAFRLQRINKRGIDGQEQWYKSKAAIGSFSNTALFIAIDSSSSMTVVTSNGETRWTNMKTALVAALTPFLGMPYTETVDIEINQFSTFSTTILRRGVGGTEIQELINWVNALPSPPPSGLGTDFEAAIDPAVSFFAGAGNKNRISLFITDGLAEGGSEVPAGATFDSIENLTGYAANIDLSDTSKSAYLDNTPEDGIPVLNGGSTAAIENVILWAIFAHYDMNPAHIIRECLTDLDWGMGYQDSDIDDASFMAAADTMFDEQMGISLLWDRQNKIEDFVKEIIKHIDGALFVERTTGKFVLKLVRYDYVEADLIELDESNIDRIENLHRPQFGELANSVTVNYWDQKTGETSSLTVQDTALSIMQQSSINTTIQYPGFTNGRIAAQVAARDLRVVSSPLWSCTVYADKTAEDLNIGDTFKLTWGDYKLSSVIMRVTGMSFGNSKSNKVKLICTQDVFALPDDVFVESPAYEDGWQPIDNTPAAVQNRKVQEAPYYELVQYLGQTTVDADLTDNPDLGYLIAAGSRPAPEGSISAEFRVDPSTGTYEDVGLLDFAPTAYLNGAIDKVTTTFPIQNGEDLDLVVLGQHCQVDNELMRVDAISDTSITVGRGVLDTVPEVHADSAAIVFWDNYAATDETEYVASDIVNTKLLTITGEEILDEALAPVDSVTFASRAVRPYPPGDLQLNSEYFPTSLTLRPVTNDVNLTYASRNRIQQTSGTLLDFTDPDVTPEAGTEYSVRVYSLPGLSLVDSADNISATSYSVDLSAEANGDYRFELWSTRDGYESFQKYSIDSYVDTGIPPIPQDLTWISSGTSPNIIISNSGRTVHTGPGATSVWHKAKGNVQRVANTGSWYFEIDVVLNGTAIAIGIAVAGTSTASAQGTTNNAGDGGRYQYFNSGQKRSGGTYSAYGASYTAGDTIGCLMAVNGSNTEVTFYKNGVSQGVAFVISGTTGNWEPHICFYSGTESELTYDITINNLPSGATPWNM